MVYLKENKIYITEDLYYTIHRLKKRLIFAPCEVLKYKQRCFLNAIRWSFPLDLDTQRCAEIHTGKKWILKMDIKHFYASVPYSDIKNFIKIVCKNIENANVNYYIDITTVNGKLPTGAPTSAYIADNCFKKADLAIQSYCNVFSVSYSRYMDDLTFSSDNKQVLKKIELKVREILSANGYRLNKKKLKYISSNKQQNILGLIVNYGKVRINNKEKRRIRAMLHSYVISISNSRNKNLKNCFWDYYQKEKLKGYIAYIQHVDNEYYQRLKNYVNKLSLKYNVDTLF